jgi:PAS domain S-box-containing protein
VLPVLAAALVTMATVTSFALVLELLAVRVSFSRGYLIPVAVVGGVAGLFAWIVFLLYRRMADETVEEVNERLRVSGELTNERMLMRALMENTPDHIYFKDTEGAYLRVNHALARALGLKDPADLLGRCASDFFAPAMSESMAEDERRVRASGVPVLAREEHVVWPDGRSTWQSTTRLPLRDRHGRTIGTFGISRDITESKLAELKIRQLSQAVEQSPSLVLITDVHGLITYVNPKFSLVTGYTADEVVGRNPRFLKGGGMPNRVYEEMWATISSGGEWSGELLNRKKDGATYWGLASISPIRDAGGKITLYLEVMEDITSRKQAEQALRRQFAFQRQLIDAMPIPIFHKDRHGVYQECNEAFSQFLGRDREEIVGHTAFDLAPPDLAAAYHGHDLDLMRLGRDQRYESEVLHQDGSRHAVMFSKALVHDDEGEVTGIVGALVDLTGLKRAEAALLAENRRREELEKIIGNSPAMVFLWRAEPGWPVEFVSDSVRQLGYTPEDFVPGGMPFAQLVHPEDLARVDAEVTDYTGRGVGEFSQQYRVFSRRGEIRWLDDRTWVRRGPDGRATHFQGILMDVTDRVEAEARQRAVTEGLRAILEIADVLIASPDSDELYRRAVELAREKLRLERTAIMLVTERGLVGTYGTNLRGKTVSEQEHVIHLDDIWRARLQPRPPGESPWMIVNEPYYEWDGQSMIGFGHGWSALTPILSHQHGAIGFFCNDSAISGAPVDAVKQEILGVFCALLGNIMARKRMEEEQQRIEAQHRDFMERTDRLNSLGMLAAGMAHEINNPLQGMLSHLHAVHRAVKGDEAARKSLVMVERGIDSIATLVRKLLIFGRSHEQEGETVDAREALEFVTQLLASPFKRSRVSLAVHAPGEALVVQMPRRYLIQVLLNLLINARDAMPEGGTVSIEAKREGERALIRIADTGHGIPPEQLPEIFKPFHTTKGAKGTGLGLSVVDSLVRASHGVIRVDSEPGKGAAFTLDLPLRKVES